MSTIQDRLHEVFCKYPEIAFAYLFGSYATGEQTVLSDIDIAVYLQKQPVFDFNKLLLFHGDCCRTLQRNDIDILVLNTTRNLILLKEIITHGKIIFNIDQKLLDDFEVKLLHSVHDFTERTRLENTL